MPKDKSLHYILVRTKPKEEEGKNIGFFDTFEDAMEQGGKIKDDCDTYIFDYYIETWKPNTSSWASCVKIV